VPAPAAAYRTERHERSRDRAANVSLESTAGTGTSLHRTGPVSTPLRAPTRILTVGLELVVADAQGAEVRTLDPATQALTRTLMRRMGPRLILPINVRVYFVGCSTAVSEAVVPSTTTFSS